MVAKKTDDPVTLSTLGAVRRFNEAFDRHKDGTTGHIRGVDLFRVRDGKVAEKLAYVKG